MKDSIVKEMRDIRLKIEAEYDHDVEKYLQHIYQSQKNHGKKLVRRQPKPLKKRRAM